MNNRSIIMQTRDKIIEKTFTLLIHNGYDGVSISDIQSYVGISRGLLYHYFGNKDALLIEATKHHLTTHFPVRLEIMSKLTVQQAIEYVVDLYDKLTTNVSIINYDFLLYRAMQESVEIAEIYKEIRKEEVEGWRLVLSNSIKAGDIRDDLDVVKIAAQFIYLSDGVWLRAVTPLTEINLIEALKETLETFYTLLKK